MGYIYKITNLVNGKIYIGLTTLAIKERWRMHKAESKRNNKHLYSAMRKYGIENFKIEEIDSTEDFQELGMLERKYIQEYKSYDEKIGYNNSMGGESNQLDGNPRAKLALKEVEEIRQIYSECKIGTKECWALYKDKISYDAFEKIYEGHTWRSVMPEVYTKENKERHKTLMKARKGEKNGNAKIPDNMIMEIREYYSTHTLKECFEKYGKDFKTKASFRGVVERGYSHLPRYSKIEKKWIKPE